MATRDVTLKELVVLRPRDILTLAGITDAIDVWLEESDLSSIVAIADKVLHVRLAQGELLVHFEFQAGHDGELPGRVFWYNAALHHRHKLPVVSVVILLTPKADARTITGRYQVATPNGRECLAFHYDVIRLWKTPVETILNGPVGLLPLAPLCAGIDNIDRIIAKMEPRLRQETTREEEGKLWLAAYTLLGLQFDAQTALKLLPKGKAMQESETYQAIVEEGRQKGRQEGRREEAIGLLLRLGQRNLGAPAAGMRARIEEIDDLDLIEALIAQVTENADWDSLLAGATLPPRKPRKKKR